MHKFPTNGEGKVIHTVKDVDNMAALLNKLIKLIMSSHNSESESAGEESKAASENRMLREAQERPEEFGRGKRKRKPADHKVPWKDAPKRRRRRIKDTDKNAAPPSPAAAGLLSVLHLYHLIIVIQLLTLAFCGCLAMMPCMQCRQAARLQCHLPVCYNIVMF